MVLAVYNLSRKRVSVDMNVGRAHKYRNLQTLFLEELSVKNLFNHHHFSIRRRHYSIFIVCERPGGYPEEGYDEKPESEKDNIDSPGNNI
jgi:hypothetical protein